MLVPLQVRGDFLPLVYSGIVHFLVVGRVLRKEAAMFVTREMRGDLVAPLDPRVVDFLFVGRATGTAARGFGKEAAMFVTLEVGGHLDTSLVLRKEKEEESENGARAGIETARAPDSRESCGAPPGCACGATSWWLKNGLG